VRIDIRKAEAIKQGDKVLGNRTKIKITKNKVAPPFRACEVDVMYGEGISKDGDLMDLGMTLNLINKSGSWFSYGEMRLGQGRENAKQYIKEHPELCHEIENVARKHYGLKELEALALPDNYISVDPQTLRDTGDDEELDIELVNLDDSLEYDTDDDIGFKEEE
jgi:recombination protein RecA